MIDYFQIFYIALASFVSLILMYFIIIFVVARLIIPNLGFSKSKIEQVIPKDMGETIKRIQAESKDDYDFLWKAYNYVTGKYDGKRKKISELERYFWKINSTWPVHEYLPDTQQNKILRTLLVGSNYFTEDKIKIKHCFLNYKLHQYMIVETTKGNIEVDPASDFIGISFNKHAQGFK